MRTKPPDPDALYADRRLTEGFPALEELAARYRAEPEATDRVDGRDVQKTLRYAGRLVDLSGPRRIVVIGCGHRPKVLMALLELGHKAIGIEPVQSYVDAARAYLGRDEAVLRGAAESIPLPDGSQDLVLFENVLEHVDSVSVALAEIHRVTAPGGIALIKTNSRLSLSPTSEFRVPFFNWLPSTVKEAYVHRHLHFDPKLANFSSRPAVHWFDYAQLCRAGREAGFARFYSLLDVLKPSDPSIARSGFRRRVFRLAKYHPWVRAAVLTQLGGIVYMWKRHEVEGAENRPG